jgi:hypothetical protein
MFFLSIFTKTHLNIYQGSKPAIGNRSPGAAIAESTLIIKKPEASKGDTRWPLGECGE